MNRQFVSPPHGFVGVSGSALPFYLSKEEAEEERDGGATEETSRKSWVGVWDSVSSEDSSVEDEVVGAGLLTGIQLAEAYSHHFLVPVFDPDLSRPLPVDPSVANLLPQQFCAENLIVPLADDGTTIDVAIVSPQGLMLREEVLRISQRTMRALFATKEVVVKVFEEIYEVSDQQPAPDAVGSTESVSFTPIASSESIDVEPPSEGRVSSDGRALAEEFLRSAVKRGASEASIETFGGECQARLRLLGKLCSWVPEDSSGLTSFTDGSGLIFSLLKLAGVYGGQDDATEGINNHNVLCLFETLTHPKGTIRIRHGRRRLTVEIEAFRTVAGIKLTARFQGRETTPRRLSDLGMFFDQEEWVKKVIGLERGLFLVFGAPRSGKRTTLSAMMDFLNHPERSLVSVEESVRVVQPGVSQFATTATRGLGREQLIRRALRQSPDVLMVDRIEDRSDATACLDATHQGVLVMASFDAADWSTAISRLHNFGLAQEGRRTSVTGLLGQRLVPRLCHECRHLERSLFAESRGTRWTAQGCRHCAHSGYRGRLAVFDHQTQLFESGILQTHRSGFGQWSAAVRRHCEGLMDWETLENCFAAHPQTA